MTNFYWIFFFLNCLSLLCFKEINSLLLELLIFSQGVIVRKYKYFKELYFSNLENKENNSIFLLALWIIKENHDFRKERKKAHTSGAHIFSRYNKFLLAQLHTVRSVSHGPARPGNCLFLVFDELITKMEIKPLQEALSHWTGYNPKLQSMTLGIKNQLLNKKKFRKH